MKYYFYLQYKRLVRWIKDMGLHPHVGVLLGVLTFVILSKLLFYKTEYANGIYSMLAIWLVFKLSDKKRNNLLKNTFNTKAYSLLRVIENGLMVLPFQIYLALEKEFALALLLTPVALGLSLHRTHQMWYKTLPTPFKKFPFEYIVGFRKTFWVIAIAYFLITRSIQFDNYNLGLFGLGLIFLTGIFYYQNMEAEYFIWIHSDRTNKFLRRKFSTSMICASILSLLALTLVLIAFPSNWTTTILVDLAGHALLGSIILAKYSSYPYKMNIPQGVLYALSLAFPPMLVITCWIFYLQSRKRLKPILEC